MEENFYIEVHCQQINHEGERICGDVFLSARVKEENRTVVVLSDGMGHGVKANVLATLTATMALNFTKEHKDFRKIAEIIMNTLPVCSERKISYSTFSIIDIENDGQTRILEYDNPQCTIVRDSKIFDPTWTCLILDSPKHKGKELRLCSFFPKKEDRIIIYSDGVAQSGLGSKYPFGWSVENIAPYALTLIKQEKIISAQQLASKIVNMAAINDNYHSKDDTSCAVIYFREPRKLLICTGPPYETEKDVELGKIVGEFQGKKIVCGGTTSDIISKQLKRPIQDSFEFDDPDLPPISYMDGIDLITEGILTLSKAADILSKYTNSYKLGKGPADQIVKLIKESDEIHFIIGTRINIAHQDPNLPVELEIRRTVVKRIAKFLEEKFLKEVFLRFI